MQFYYVIPDHDFHNELRYLSNDNHIILLFKCPVPLNPEVDVYVEHKALIPLSMEKQLLIRDVSFEPRVSDGDNDDDDVGEWFDIELNEDDTGCSGYDNEIDLDVVTDEVSNDVISEEELNDVHVHDDDEDTWYEHVEEDVMGQDLNGSDGCEHVNDDDDMFLDLNFDDMVGERFYNVSLHRQPHSHITLTLQIHLLVV